jgi:hypothetical protein|tara:strand:- start:11 stop:145 length:135 start_codon:yes stop_codon:yes gene_type:complete
MEDEDAVEEEKVMVIIHPIVVDQVQQILEAAEAAEHLETEAREL